MKDRELEKRIIECIASRKTAGARGGTCGEQKELCKYQGKKLGEYIDRSCMRRKNLPYYECKLGLRRTMER